MTPLVMAKQVSLLPAITLLAQIFFATFFGFLGLFLALPLTVVGQVWFKEVVIKDVLDRWKDDSETSKKYDLKQTEERASESDHSPNNLENLSISFPNTDANDDLSQDEPSAQDTLDRTQYSSAETTPKKQADT